MKGLTQGADDEIKVLGALIPEAPRERQLGSSSLPEAASRNAEAVQHLQSAFQAHPIDAMPLTFAAEELTAAIT